MKQIVQLFSATILVSFASAGEPTPLPPPEPRFKISGWIDSGITFNPDSPPSNQNLGRLFDDRANEPLLNQVVINFERALAPRPAQFDWGFKLQFMFGCDARFIHSLGLFDNTAATSIVQPDVVEAYLNLHFPVISPKNAAGLEQEIDFIIGKKFLITVRYELIESVTQFAKLFEKRSLDDRNAIAVHGGYIFMEMMKEFSAVC